MGLDVAQRQRTPLRRPWVGGQVAGGLSRLILAVSGCLLAAVSSLLLLAINSHAVGWCCCCCCCTAMHCGCCSLFALIRHIELQPWGRRRREAARKWRGNPAIARMDLDMLAVIDICLLNIAITGKVWQAACERAFSLTATKKCRWKVIASTCTLHMHGVRWRKKNSQRFQLISSVSLLSTAGILSVFIEVSCLSEVEPLNCTLCVWPNYDWAISLTISMRFGQFTLARQFSVTGHYGAF